MSKKSIESSRFIHVEKLYLKPIAWVLFAPFKRVFTGARLTGQWLRAIFAFCFCIVLPALPVVSMAADSTHIPNTGPTESTITTFAHAQFLQSVSMAIPAKTSAWQMIDLPDSWRQQQRDWEKFGWYRLTFNDRPSTHTSTDSGQRAIYIPRITNNIEIYLNKQSFAVSGRFFSPPQESWNLAQYYLIPSSMIRDGENEILIRLHPDNYSRAGIANVLLGPSELIEPLYMRRHFVQTTAPQLITGVLVVMAILSFALWLRRRSETIFLLFGLMAAVAVVRLFHHYLRETPAWLGLMAVPAMCWLTALQINFSLHYAKRPMPRLERGLIIFAAVASVLLFVSIAADFFWTATTIVYALLAVLTPVFTAILIYQLTRVITRGNILMIVAVLLTSGFGVHDFLNYRELLGYDRLYLIPLGLPMLLVAVAALLVRRFVETLENYESLNAGLANRIADKERDLEASFARERVLDQQRATAEERQRLMRDMHDGIGSQLMSTLAVMKRSALSREALETIIADCIDELKLTIDSLEPVERDLLVVLGNLRYRLEPRLQAAGISLQWAVNDLPPLDYLDPENVRSILRIVQEAFTNTLKHGNASRITLSTGVDHATNRVLVRVTDDGHSYDPGKISGGRGLANMKSRAESMRGSVEIIPLKGGGTCVNLLLPLTAPSTGKSTPK